MIRIKRSVETEMNRKIYTSTAPSWITYHPLPCSYLPIAPTLPICTYTSNLPLPSTTYTPASPYRLPCPYLSISDPTLPLSCPYPAVPVLSQSIPTCSYPALTYSVILPTPIPCPFASPPCPSTFLLPAPTYPYLPHTQQVFTTQTHSTQIRRN